MLMQLEIHFLLFLCGTVGLKGFAYEDPDKEWGKEYPACNGDQQSPIDIQMNISESPPIEERILRWNNYDNIPDSMKLVNIGHTFQINPQWSSDSDRPYLSGGPLDGDYVVEEFHFHWGPNDTAGTEHSLNGKRLTLEFQMVHWKRDYGSLQEAVKNPDGVAIVAAGHFPKVLGHSGRLEQIFGKLESIKRENEEVELESFPLSDLPAVDNGDFYLSYHGSLTTPGCHEAVTWLLAINLYEVTTDEMEKIRSFGLANGDDHNNRPTQPLNGRQFSLFKSN